MSLSFDGLNKIFEFVRNILTGAVILISTSFYAGKIVRGIDCRSEKAVLNTDLKDSFQKERTRLISANTYKEEEIENLKTQYAEAKKTLSLYE